MRKDIPKETMEHKVRNLTTGSALHIRALSKNLIELENRLLSSFVNKTHIILHHSLTKDSRTVSWNPIRKYHIDKFDTDEIGYHFGIEEVRDDNIYEVLYGRRINETGIHCPQGGMNRFGIGFMFCGNFDLEPPPTAMLDKASSFIADICITTGIAPENIKGHRDFNSNKTCPGKLFNIGEFIELVIQKL